MPIQQAVTLVCDGLTGIPCDAKFPTSHSSINDAKREAKENGWSTPRVDKTERIACPVHGPDVPVPRAFLLDLVDAVEGEMRLHLRTILGLEPTLGDGPFIHLGEADPETSTIDVQGGGAVNDAPAIPPIRPRQRQAVDPRDPVPPPPPSEPPHEEG